MACGLAARKPHKIEKATALFAGCQVGYPSINVKVESACKGLSIGLNLVPDAPGTQQGPQQFPAWSCKDPPRHFDITVENDFALVKAGIFCQREQQRPAAQSVPVLYAGLALELDEFVLCILRDANAVRCLCHG